MRFSFRSLVSFSVIATALCSSPSGNYGPASVACPDSDLLRNSLGISSHEQEWVGERHKKTAAAIREFVANAGLEVDDDVLNSGINVALGFSGGGYRAMFNGAGQLAALDNRTAAEGGLGGVLQSATYIGALSGGAWLLASLAMQNFPLIDEVVLENPYDLWNITEDRQLINQTNYLALGWDAIWDDFNSLLTHANYWDTPSGKGIKADIAAKQNAGFPTSLTDTWGRGLAHQLFPKGTNNWMNGATWSDIRNISAFANHDMPFPLVSALARRPQLLEYDLNSPLVEFNAFEMGSFDTLINSFFDIAYLGTNVLDGLPTSSCVAGFDNSAFVLGTSSSLFNEFLNTLVCPTCTGVNGLVKPIVRNILENMSKNHQDIALYKPNPFFDSQYVTSDNISSSDTLYLMDGGLAGEIIPLSTMMVKERDLDVVFAYDNNGAEWPDGSAVINTYERQFLYEGKSTVCPYIPGQSTFLHYNLTAKPAFFGCDRLNLTALVKDGVYPPLMIYTANRPFEYYSNQSTLKLEYNDFEKKGMIQNGFDVASRLNGTIDDSWNTCVACAMVRRAEERLGKNQSETCQRCFEEYCWDGSLYEETISRDVNFTLDGLTNGLMTLWGNSTYIYQTPKNTQSFWSSLLLFFRHWL